MKRGGQISGVVSLVTFFCALCMAVFTVLTLSTANREYSLTRLAEERAAAYYLADRQAVEQVAAMAATPLPEGEESGIAFPVGDDLMLEVVLRGEGGTNRVLRWQTVYRGDWQPDTSIKVWSGE